MVNRTMCSVLEEMRSCFKTRNFAGLLGLIEDAQSLANRMESAIEDKRDLARWRKRVSKEKDALRALLVKTNAVRVELGEEEQEMPYRP